MKRIIPRLEGAAKQLAKGELIGLRCRISEANDSGIIGLEGDVVDETLHTLTIRMESGRRIQLAKPGATFSFLDEQGNWVPVAGRAIDFRPEDRSKKVK